MADHSHPWIEVLVRDVPGDEARYAVVRPPRRDVSQIGVTFASIHRTMADRCGFDWADEIRRFNGDVERMAQITGYPVEHREPVR